MTAIPMTADQIATLMNAARNHRWELENVEATHVDPHGATTIRVNVARTVDPGYLGGQVERMRVRIDPDGTVTRDRDAPQPVNPATGKEFGTHTVEIPAPVRGGQDRASCPEGESVVVHGEVLKTDVKTYGNGDVREVMTVKADEGWAVWGTVPRSLSGVEKGDRVEFVATVVRADDKDDFGFYKRPRAARRI